MTRNVRIHTLLFAGAAVLAAAACSSQNAGQPSSTAAGTTAVASKPPVPVTTAAAALGTFHNSVEVVGTLAPKFSADVKSEVTATVTEVYVTEWVPVRKGDRLARLDTTRDRGRHRGAARPAKPRRAWPSRARSASTSARSS